MYAKDIDITFYRNPGKLRLVKPDPKYAPITIKWIGRTDVTKYLGADFSKMTLSDEVDHLKNMVTDDDRFSWMIELDGDIVGNVEINEIKELTDKYGLKTGAFCTLIGDPANWGKGLGSCAKQAACNWAFEEGGFELIEAKAYAGVHLKVKAIVTKEFKKVRLKEILSIGKCTRLAKVCGRS